MKPDLVKAYYWISLSAGRGDRNALDARDYVSENMTVEQIVEGKRLVREQEEYVARQNACSFCKVFTGKPAP